MSMPWPRVYTYDLPPALSRLDLHESLPPDSPRQQYSFERLFTEQLRATVPASRPEDADIFYVPAMLVLGFFELRSQPNATAEWSAQLESTLRRVGPW